MRRAILFAFLIAFPDIAFSYDNEKSEKELVECLVKNQKEHGFNNGARLIMSCDKQHKNFLIQNNCLSMGLSYCEVAIGEVIFDVMQKFPKGIKQ